MGNRDPSHPRSHPSAAITLLLILASCKAQQSFLVQQNCFSSSRHATQFRQIHTGECPPPPPPPIPQAVHIQKIFVHPSSPPLVINNIPNHFLPPGKRDTIISVVL